MNSFGGKIYPDFLILGAGIAGTALAVALKKKGLQVLLIERDSSPRERFKGEFLQSYAVKQLLSLGFDASFCGVNFQKIQQM